MISFIGAGRVGVALGRYFKQKGLAIGGYYSRTYEHAQHAAKQTESGAHSNITDLLNNSTMVWITASDDALGLLANEISELHIPHHVKAFVHASGVHSTDILQPIRDAGFSTYCAHPLMAFGEANESVKQLNDAYFTMDRPKEEIGSGDENYLIGLFEKTGNHVLEIESHKKELYHCAAAVLSNYMVTLLNMSYEMFAESGMTKSDIKKATAPLLKSTLKNIADNEEMRDALTGAIKRGDKATVEKHLLTLEKNMPDKKTLYKELGKETMAMLGDYKLRDVFG